MAKGKKSFLRGFLKFILVVVIIVALIGGTLHFTTPRTFGLADKKIINGQSLSDLGLGDTSNLEILFMVQKLLTPPNKENIVSLEDSPKQEDVDKVNAIIKEDKPIYNADFGDLVSGKIYFQEEKEIQLTNSETAALINSVLEGINAGAKPAGDIRFDGVLVTDKEGNEVEVTLNKETVLVVFKQLKPYAESLSNVKNDEGEDVISVVYSVKVPEEYKDEVAKLPINVADTVYFTIDTVVKLQDKALVPQSTTVQINTLSLNQSDSIIGAFMSILGIEGEGLTELSQDFKNSMGGVTTDIINNLGEVNSIGSDGISLTTRTK